MNTQVTVRPASTAPVRATPNQIAQLVPQNMTEAMQLAELMATSKLVPAALQKSPADCLMVIMQAVRWQMDPFAVAQECSVISGKLMYSGKLAAAVINSRGNLADRLSFSYTGEGNTLAITLSGRFQGEACPRTVGVRLIDARTNNKVWQTQPEQQLMYHGSRVWGRRHTPELMLGVWSPEEFPESEDFEEKPPKITAVARKAEIAAIGDPDERAAQTEKMIDEWSDRQSSSLRNAMRSHAAEPPHDEDGVIIEPPADRSAALQYMAVTRDVIRTARDADKLTTWLNSPEQKQERQKAKLTDAELISIRDFAAARKAQLKAANGNGAPSHEDPDAFYKYVTAKMAAAKDEDELANVYAAIVEPVESKMFPPDVTALTDAYARRERELRA